MKGGTRPTKIDHRDFDYHKTFGSVGAATPFLAYYNTDAGLTMPDQNAVGLEFGCTDETTADVSTDISLVKKDPFIVEDITHANVNRGEDVRTSLLVGVNNLKWFTAIFNVLPIDGQDFFDAVRDAMASGGTEKRSVSVGSKWFDVFERADATGMLPMPNFADQNFTWHNWKICGWETGSDNQIYLIGKSWQGPNYGAKGFHKISRTLFNQLMAAPGSVAFTATTGILPPIQTISTTWLQWLLSYARTLLPYS